MDRTTPDRRRTGLVSVHLRPRLPEGPSRICRVVWSGPDDPALRAGSDDHGPQLRILSRRRRNEVTGVPTLWRKAPRRRDHPASPEPYPVRYPGPGFRLAQPWLAGRLRLESVDPAPGSALGLAARTRHRAVPQRPPGLREHRGEHPVAGRQPRAGRIEGARETAAAETVFRPGFVRWLGIRHRSTRRGHSPALVRVRLRRFALESHPHGCAVDGPGIREECRRRLVSPARATAGASAGARLPVREP